MNKPIGLLGGTFDPVHFGHLRLAEEAYEALDLAHVLWIPTGVPPHRHVPRVSAAQRLNMVQLAIAGNARFELDASEIATTQPAYTVHTLARLREAQNRGGDGENETDRTRPLLLILGSDAFLGLTTWHRWRELFDYAHIAVATRPGFELHPTDMAPPLAAEYTQRLASASEVWLGKSAGYVVPFAMTPLAVSASLIRARLAAGLSARYLIPDPVREYIDQQHLYQAADGR